MSNQEEIELAKYHILIKYRKDLLDILDCEIKELNLRVWRNIKPENKEIAYEKMLRVRELKTLVENL
jgi:hypothetical protein